MAYDIKSKFKANSPLPCWKGYERVPGTRPGAKGSCRKSSPKKTMGYEVKIQKGKVVSEKERPHNDFKPGREGESQHEAYHNRFPEKPFTDAEGRPLKQQKGGGTKKVCLPKAKVNAMSESKRKSLASAKSKAGSKGEYKRPSSTNVKGARKKGATLRNWFEDENWVQVGNPSKKCGEA